MSAKANANRCQCQWMPMPIAGPEEMPLAKTRRDATGGLEEMPQPDSKRCHSQCTRDSTAKLEEILLADLDKTALETSKRWHWHTRREGTIDKTRSTSVAIAISSRWASGISNNQ